MTITDVVKKKGGCYRVYADSEELGDFGYDIIALYGIKPGLCCDEEFIEKAVTDEQRRKAREKAFRLLSYRDHSRRELVDKLSCIVPCDIAEETADRMEEIELIDDVRYAKKLANQQLVQKCRGRRRAVYELVCKGISREIAEDAVDSVEVDFVSQICRLILKKYPDAVFDTDKQRKAAAAMQRRGYSYDEFRRAIERLADEAKENEEDE